MIINNYGLFWNIEDVFWGKQKNEGNLYGKLAKGRRTPQVDFREQSGIYALYADYDLIYIGQTGRKGQKLLSRLKQHKRDSLADRWNKFSWFGTRQVLNDGKLKAEKGGTHTTHTYVLNHMEAILISVSEPALNRQGGKWGRKVDQYLQERDTRLGPSIQEMIEEIWKKKNNSQTDKIK